MEHTEEQLALFEKYEMNEARIEVFDQVRAEDFRLIQLICAKKIYEKVIAMAPRFHQLLEDFGLEGFDIEKQYCTEPFVRKLMGWRAIWFPLGYESESGAPIFFCVCDFREFFRFLTIYDQTYGNMERTQTDAERNVMIRFFLGIMDDLFDKCPKAMSRGIAMYADCSTMGIRNFDFAAERIGALMMRAYPVRFKKMLLIDAPWYIRFLLALLKPFYSGKVMSRIHSVTRADLPDHFAEGHLPLAWGGEREFDYDDWVKNELQVTSWGLPEDEVVANYALRRLQEGEAETEGEGEGGDDVTGVMRLEQFAAEDGADEEEAASVQLAKLEALTRDADPI